MSDTDSVFLKEQLQAQMLPAACDTPGLKLRTNHSFTRALILPTIIGMMMERYQYTENEALDRFYRSATGASFSDDETGLYGQSPNYIFSLFVEEQEDQPPAE